MKTWIVVAVLGMMSVMPLGCGGQPPDSSQNDVVNSKPKLNCTNKAVGQQVRVDYRRTLAQMIEAGKYDLSYLPEDNDMIVEKNFPIQRPAAIWSAVNVEVVLVHLEDPTYTYPTTNRAFRYMDDNLLRPGRIEDLLAFGEKCPEIQLEFAIVALGSLSLVCTNDYNKLPCAPRLFSDGSKRHEIIVRTHDAVHSRTKHTPTNDKSLK